MGKRYGDKPKETIYVFGDKYVVHKRDEDTITGSVTGIFKTSNVIVKYAMNDVGGSKCILIGNTRSKYPYGLLKGEMNAITEAIRHVSEKEHTRVMQRHSKPDYGFEAFKATNRAHLAESEPVLSGQR